MRPYSLLLIDIGNTSVKLRRASLETLAGKTRRVPTEIARKGREGSAVVRAMLRGWKYARVILCSVVPDATGHVLAALPDGVLVTRIRPDLRGIGVDLGDYPQRRTLGADRLANIAGAVALYGTQAPGGGSSPLIVVDFGTATTFNVLDAEHRFLGGVIAPGLAGMSMYLSARGSQLPELRKLRLPASAVGRSTTEAMLAGTVLGYRGLVREILTSLATENPGAKVIATGGDAHFVAELLPECIDLVDPSLTMHGLRVIAKQTV